MAPSLVTNYTKPFQVLKALPCDIFLDAHGSYYRMEAKYERLQKHPKAILSWTQPAIGPMVGGDSTFEAPAKPRGAMKSPSRTPSPFRKLSGSISETSKTACSGSSFIWLHPSEHCRENLPAYAPAPSREAAFQAEPLSGRGLRAGKRSPPLARRFARRA